MRAGLSFRRSRTTSKTRPFAISNWNSGTTVLPFRISVMTAASPDRIADFADRQDLIVIESGAERFQDLRITDLGADARVSFGNVQITLANLDHARLDAADFLFI